MSRIAKADVNRALQLAADTIVQAGGTDGRTSRADLTAKLATLPAGQKQLVDIFFKFVDARDFKAGAQVTAADVKRAVSYAKEHMVAKYDLNANGLSKDEIAKMSLTGKRAVELAKALKAAPAAPSAEGTPVKLTAKLEYVYSNECDNQSTLQAKVKLPNGKTVNVELRNPAWANWDAMEKAGGKTFAVEGHVILNSALKDINALNEGTPAEQAEGSKAWDDMFKDTKHWIDTNQTEGILVVDKMTVQP
jgi:hypothetical protein